MKKYLRMMILCAVFGVVFGGATQVFGQTEMPMPGGYGTAEVTEVEVISAANFAVKSQMKKQKAKFKLNAISRAEKQVVAGMNYRLCLQVEMLEKGKPTAVPQTIQTVVFRSLKGKQELTSWAIAACADEMPTETPKP